LNTRSLHCDNFLLLVTLDVNVGRLELNWTSVILSYHIISYDGTALAHANTGRRASSTDAIEEAIAADTIMRYVITRNAPRCLSLITVDAREGAEALEANVSKAGKMRCRFG